MRSIRKKIKLLWIDITTFTSYITLIFLAYATIGISAMIDFLITTLITILVTPMALACLAVDKIRRRRNAKCK